MDIFEKLSEQLKAEGASFRVIAHEPEGRSDKIALIRGTRLEQGAKAMLCKVTGRGVEDFVLAIVPSDRRVDMKALAALLGGDKASVAPLAAAQELTGCVPGAIPPLSYNERVKLVVDSGLVEREKELAFNAGRLDRSIILSTADYVRIFRPRLAAIAAQ